MESESIVILTDRECERLVTPTAAIESLERAFLELFHGTAVFRPRSRTFMARNESPHTYRLCSMEGGGRNLGYYVVRIQSNILGWGSQETQDRFVKVVPDEDRDRFEGLIFLFDIESARLVAVMPNNAISRRRVGSTSAVAAKRLARKDSRTLGIIGSGSHAVGHVLAFTQVFQLDRIVVWSPNPEHRRSFRERVERLTQVPVGEAGTAKEVFSSDLVVTCTNSLVPVYETDWLVPGCHLTSINEREMPVGLDERVDVSVVKSNPQHIYGSSLEVGQTREMTTTPPPLPPNTLELKDIVGRGDSYRSKAEDITLFRNNEGMGLEFAAVASAAYLAAVQQGVGTPLPLSLLTAQADSETFGRVYFQMGRSRT